jgi:hypothetical protein
MYQFYNLGSQIMTKGVTVFALESSALLDLVFCSSIG